MAKHTLEPHETWHVYDSSKIQEYMRCPRRFFFKYVLGWSTSGASVDLVFGTAWHEAIGFLMEKKDYSNDAVAQAYLMFEETYRKTFSPLMDIDNEPKIPVNALRALSKYAETFKDDLKNYTFKQVEIAGSVMISDSQSIRFRIDAVCEDNKTGEIYAMEHKTTKSMNYRWAAQWRQKFQLGCYTHVLYCIYPEEKVSGIIVNGVQITNAPSKPGGRDIEFQRVPIRLSTDRMADWCDQADFYVSWIDNEFQNLDACSVDDLTLRAFPKCTESCGDFFGCPFIDYCCTYTNPLKVAHRMPMNITKEFWDPRSNEAKAKEIIHV